MQAHSNNDIVKQEIEMFGCSIEHRKEQFGKGCWRWDTKVHYIGTVK